MFCSAKIFSYGISILKIVKNLVTKISEHQGYDLLKTKVVLKVVNRKLVNFPISSSQNNVNFGLAGISFRLGFSTCKAVPDLKDAQICLRFSVKSLLSLAHNLSVGLHFWFSLKDVNFALF